MLVINSATVSSIADLNAHSKNLLKTLEIAHQAYIVSSLDFGSGIPPFALKNSHVQEFIAATLGFNTYAAMQSKVKTDGIALSLKDFNKDKLSERILKTVGHVHHSYAEFLADYFNEYLSEALLVIEPPVFGTELPTSTQLSKYLPMLRYLTVKPFSLAMRNVVEDSYTFNFSNGGKEDVKLRTDHRFPLDGWIQVAILNNLIEQSAEPFLAGYEQVEVPTCDFFYGSPRLSQRHDIYNFLSTTNRIGTEYYQLSDDVLMWHKKHAWIGMIKNEYEEKVSNYKLIFDLLPRTKAILQNYVPKVVEDYVFNGTFSMSYDLYEIQDIMDKYTPQVIDAKIYEATKYFLEVCRNHLKDLNPVLHLNKTEAFLSVRNPTVNEICWRRQVCHYAENMLNAAKYIFSDYIVTEEELDLKKVFFNDFGFLMFDLEKDITFYIYSLGRKITLSPYNFSIFFNFLASLVYIKFGKLDKKDDPSLVALTYLRYLTLKDLLPHPSFKHLADMFDMELIEDAMNLAIHKFDAISCRFEHINAEVETAKEGSQSQKTLLTVCPKSLGYEAILLRGYQLCHPEIKGMELIKKLKGHRLEDTVEVRNTVKNKLKLNKLTVIPLDGAEYFYDLDFKSRESHLGALSAFQKYVKKSEVFDFGETLDWLAEKLSGGSYTAKKEAIAEIEEINPALYALLNYLLNRPISRPHKPPFDDVDYKNISIMAEKTL